MLILSRIKKCHSIQEFLTEVSSFKDVMDLEETEETWDRIERGLARFSAVIKGGGYQFKKELVDALKILPRPMISAVRVLVLCFSDF